MDFSASESSDTEDGYTKYIFDIVKIEEVGKLDCDIFTKVGEFYDITIHLIHLKDGAREYALGATSAKFAGCHPEERIYFIDDPSDDIELDHGDIMVGETVTVCCEEDELNNIRPFLEVYRDVSKYRPLIYKGTYTDNVKCENLGLYSLL